MYDNDVDSLKGYIKNIDFEEINIDTKVGKLCEVRIGKHPFLSDLHLWWRKPNDLLQMSGLCYNNNLENVIDMIQKVHGNNWRVKHECKNFKKYTYFIVYSEKGTDIYDLIDLYETKETC